jgi:hypothetical protein
MKRAANDTSDIPQGGFHCRLGGTLMFSANQFHHADLTEL